MQSSQTNQSIHYEDDSYNLDIELKATASSSINPHDDVNLNQDPTITCGGCW